MKPTETLHMNPIITKLLEHCRSGAVLDLGAGDSQYVLELARRGFKVTAVDNHDKRMDILDGWARAEELPIEVVRADMATYIPTQQYDVVLSVAALFFWMLSRRSTWCNG